jgi:hypothetical protein
MNDFVLMLTATLQLPPVNVINSNNEADDRTIVEPLHETNRLYQRCQSIRE